MFDRFKLEKKPYDIFALIFLGFIQAIGCLGVVGFKKAEGGELHGEEEGLPGELGRVEGWREGIVEN
jgi:hypothetical protein